MKGYGTRGKRASLFRLALVEELPPEKPQEEEEQEQPAPDAAGEEMTSYTTPPSRSEEDLMDELTGQGHLFDDM